jgi:hypothetical protein
MAMTAHASAPPEDGFVLTQWGSWNMPGAIASVEEAHRVGARHVAVMVSLCQDGQSGSDVHWCDETPGTPFEATQQGRDFAQLVGEIQDRGMSFGILPIIFSGQGLNRQWIWPKDHSAWFQSYGDRMVELGSFASAHGGTSFVVGSELTLLFVEDWAWRDVIRRVRGVYGGHLTISPVFVQFETITFWDALDSIGVSAYFPLTASDSYLDQQFVLNMAWKAIQTEIEAYALAHFKPITFVEVGYPNTDVAATQPWDYDWGKRKLNEDLARRCWEAFRNAWSHSKMLRSFQIWALSSPDDDAANPMLFSPLHKPAEDVVRQLFAERAAP